MKKFITLLTTSLLLLLAANTASATIISGTLDFSGLSTVTTTGGTVDQIDFSTLELDSATGDFSGMSTGPVDVFKNLALNPFVKDNPLWKHDGFKFNLKGISSNEVYKGFALVQGWGKVFERVSGEWTNKTRFEWSYSSKMGNPNEERAFSVTMVPAPAGAALLGLGLLAFGLTRRSKKS